MTKQKLNLKDRTQDWCVKSDPECVEWLNDAFGTSYSGRKEYYGVFKEMSWCALSPWKHEYTIFEFREALSELEFNPKCGDMVDVSYDGINWHNRQLIGVHQNKKCTHPIFVVNKDIGHLAFKMMRKPQSAVTVTIDGTTKSPNDFTEDEWMKLHGN